MQLYLIRHPKPTVAAGVCYGSTDLSVDADDCRHLCTILLQTVPDLGQIYTSPLKRCASLATMMAADRRALDLKIDPRLRELNFGDWEMQSWNDISRFEIDAWAADTAHYRIGGGESVLEMATRVSSFYQELKALGQDAIVVCHAGTIRLLEACLIEDSIAAIASRAAAASTVAGYGDVVSLVVR